MNLLIVESPSKAKTIEKYLGQGWRVVASIGHVRDLVPENGSVDSEHDFAMKWQIMPGKEKQIKIILDEVKKADAVYLATDEDREGEAIAWHLLDILKERGALKGKHVFRATFHEITKKAVETAINNPRELDSNLVDAYLVRRALDYLIGFGISPLLWRKNLGKSAGRVQSVAVRLVVDREREIEAFKAVEYWSLDAMCAKDEDRGQKSEFNARLTRFNGEKIEKMTIGNKERMDEIVSSFTLPLPSLVFGVEKKKTFRRPAAPFTTSTLQQEAARKLYFSSKRTMSTAQKLYEQGIITYMRTDSTNLSADAVAEIRKFIGAEYGPKFLPSSPNIYVTKSKNAQEAHEAIRPTHFDRLKSKAENDEEKLYGLIWKRTIACQMTNAEFDSVSADIEPADAKKRADAESPQPQTLFHATGTTRTFDGFLKVYSEGRDEEEDNYGESKLPPLAVGDKINIEKLSPEQHFTQPPPRYTEASLIKKLEELGIGRPSTYTSIMSTITDRNYVEQDKSRRFFPTPGGWVIAAYLGKYFADLVDVNFTAKTEDAMDAVSNGEGKKLTALRSFWAPTEKLIESARGITTTEVIDSLNAVMRDHITAMIGDKCPECKNGTPVLKLGKYGAFVSCSNYPECKYIKNLPNAETAGTAGSSDSDPHAAPAQNKILELGDGITFRIGRFGPYVSDGTKNASAKKYSAETITPEIAKELLSGENKKADPVEIGENPATGKMIYFYPDGRYGAYISSNKVNVSVKEQPDLAAAAELINNKKPSAKKSPGKKK